MRNDTYLYTDGLDAARRSGQIALWRASHQANIACKKAIEDSIRQGFDGMHLKEDCAKEVLEEFGFKRVNWVLGQAISTAISALQKHSSRLELWQKGLMFPSIRV